MENNGTSKKTIIIIALIVVVAIGILYFTVLRKPKKVEYNVTKSSASADNTLIKDYDSFEKFIEKNKVEDAITNEVTFKKSTLTETYTEDFFKENSLAVVVLYEDTSKDYIHSIDTLEYNSGKTEATIGYTYKFETLAGSLSDKWYVYMFVALDKNVEHVAFQNINSKANSN